MTGVLRWTFTGSSEGIGRAGGALCNRGTGLYSTELAIGEDTVKNLWVAIKGQANKGDVIIGVYSRLPSQDDNTNELFFRERRDTSRSAALVLMGDFNLPDLNWEKSHS